MLIKDASLCIYGKQNILAKFSTRGGRAGVPNRGRWCIEGVQALGRDGNCTKGRENGTLILSFCDVYFLYSFERNDG